RGRVTVLTAEFLPLPVLRGRVGGGGFSQLRNEEPPPLPSPGIPGEGIETAETVTHPRRRERQFSMAKTGKRWYARKRDSPLEVHHMRIQRARRARAFTLV